jgi:hypothetical protein
MLIRYVIAAVLVLVGLLFIGQGLGYIPGSVMTGQPVYALVGAALVVVGGAIAWKARRSPS